jgi:hypothetical protein
MLQKVALLSFLAKMPTRMTVALLIMASLGDITTNRMEQRTLENVNNCLNTNIYSYLEASGSHSSNLYLNVVHFFDTSVY